MNTALLTNSGINKFSGGGIVSHNLMQALRLCSELKYILAGQKFPDGRYEGILAYSVNHEDYGYSVAEGGMATPFFMDYMGFHIIPKEVKIDLIQTYACPFGLTIEEMKREFDCKVVCDLAPHNIEISREEHMNIIKKYPYPHLVLDELWSLYSRHLRFADVVVVHSRKSAEYIREKARLQNDPVVIPHGCYLPENIPEYPQIFTPGYFGACLTGDAFVFSEDGVIKTIKELEIGDKIWGCDVQNNKHTIERVESKISKGTKKVFEIRVGDKKISATEDHLFLCLCNKRSKNNHYYHWTPLNKLKKGDTLITLRELDTIKRKRKWFYGKEITCDMMKVIGCYIGDGYHRRDSEFKLYLPKKDKFRKKYTKLLEREFKVEVKSRDDCLEVYSRKLVKCFINAGLFGNFKTKKIPNWVFRLEKCYIESFIEGLLDADGHYEKNNKTCKISLANEYLMKQLYMLAMQIGIRTENLRKVTSKDNRFNPSRKRTQWVTRIYISGKKIDNREKEERLTFDRNRLDIQNIVKIRYVGVREVFDITLDNSHTFYANGILTHNCGIDKGVVYMLRAWLAILESESKFLIGGRESQAFKIDEQFMKRFRTMGEVKDLNDFYSQTSIYVQPSIQDGFGITPLEAMAYGRPVIVSEGAGVSELIENGKQGFTIPFQDREALVNGIKDKIIYFKENPSEIKRMGLEARKTAQEWSWECVQREYVKIYKSLISYDEKRGAIEIT